MTRWVFNVCVPKHLWRKINHDWYILANGVFRNVDSMSQTWCQASQANGQTQMFWPLRFAKVFHDEGHCRVENHLSESPIWYHLISKHKGTEMEKASLNSIQWCSGFPIYHDLDWGYLIRYTDIHDIHDWESETSENLTDVAAPRRMRASNCTEKPLEMPITQRLARAIKTPTCKTPLAPYLSMLKPAGILSAL